MRFPLDYKTTTTYELKLLFFARYLENKMPKRHLTTSYNKY